MKRENSIEQINQEGFVFKVFKPSSEHKGDDVESSNFDVPKLNEEIINLPIEDSAFLISNPKRLLSARVKIQYKFLIFSFYKTMNTFWEDLVLLKYL